MSIITIQVGQAGNQIGEKYLSLIARDAIAGGDDASIGQHFRYAEQPASLLQSKDTERGGIQYTARAVLVDMESKAVSKVLRTAKTSGQWSYNADTGVYAGTRGMRPNIFEEI